MFEGICDSLSMVQEADFGEIEEKVSGFVSRETVALHVFPGGFEVELGLGEITATEYKTPAVRVRVAAARTRRGSVGRRTSGPHRRRAKVRLPRRSGSKELADPP